MSRRRSLGELVPRDISEVVAREARAQRGHRKAGGSLGHAFSWLKGSRRKKSLGNKSLGNVLGGVGAGTAESPKPGRQNPDPIKAGPKASDEQKQLTVHFTASQHHQENVFIQGSRPQYLEDLHTEAQEGLKIQQREDYENGVDSQDDQSFNESTSSPTQERDAASKDRAHSPEAGSPTWNSASTATSTVSAVSTRPVLTRQGSTFKPLNLVKKFEKNKTRSRRTTILGIPQQVQKELALNRSSTFGASLLPNGGGQACDTQSALSPQEGTREHRSDMEASREEQLLQHHLQAVYQDDQRLGSHRLPSSSDQRPKSLAVPWMTSSVSSTGYGFLQEPPGPVMSISPQATYLSKIIPNAVLPASVDVIQIERGNSRSRGSIHHHGGNSRAVSKSSLAHSELSGSPASSRRSGSDGSHNGSHSAATPVPATASGSNWSQTQSSETVMSQTSTVSFKPRAGTASPQTVSLAGQESRRGEPSGDLVSLQSSTSCSSTTMDGSPGSSGQASDSGIGEREGMRTSHSCSRSLSVVKTKLPPAPPRRTNSLHHVEVAKRQAEQLVQIPDLNGSQRGDTGLADVKPSPFPACDQSTVSSACSSLSPTLLPAPGAGGPLEPKPESSSASPHKAPPLEVGKFERTMSPSSGYSSQSGTPTLSPKGIPPTPPSSDKQKKRPVKPERSASRASSSAASASSSLTSLSSATSDSVHQEALASSSSPPQPSFPPPAAAATEKAAPVKQTPSPGTIRDFLDIPPHPKVKAPSPPPSETWAHNGRTIKLLCGLSPNIDGVAQPQKQQQLRDVNTEQNHKAETADSEPLKMVETDEKPTTKEDVVPPFTNGRVPLERSEAISEVVRVRQELESPESRSTEPARLSAAEGEKAGTKMRGQGPSISPLVEELKSRATLPKKETPPVMTKSTKTLSRVEIVMESQPQVQRDGAVVEVKEDSPVENDGPLRKSQVDVAAYQHEAAENASENKPMETQPPSQSLADSSATVPKTSPPPSPPPAYHPPPPPARKTPPSSVSSPPPKEGEPTDEENVPPVESCWPPPPPPPPLQALVDSVFEGPEDMDFPPPPPPLLTDSLPDVVGGGVSEMDVPCLSVMVLEEAGASSKEDVMDEVAVNAESSELSPLQTQTLVGDVMSETTLGSDSHPSISEGENSPKKDAPPLPQDVPPPPPDAPPPPPVTDGMPPSRSSLTPPSSVPPPPSKQLGELAPSGSPSSASPASAVNVLSTKSPAENNPTTVSFRRQPSLAGRDARAKELPARQKSAPVTKEDANIPLVTPSLLQMVRLRSVNVGDEAAKDHPEDSQPINGGASAQDPLQTASPSSQSVPLKPIRKSLSLKSRPPTARAPPVTLNAPSTRLQEAIRMKTAAMSSREGLSSRLSLRSSSSANSSVCDPAAPSSRSPDGGDIHKSPASTASFIFSRSAKKVVIEAPSLSPEAQASLKQSLVSELMQASDPSQVSNGTAEKADVHSSKYPGKVPPPVAKKPGLGISNPAEKGPDTNGEIESTRPAGQTAPLKELQTTTKTVTPGTIETLF